MIKQSTINFDDVVFCIESSQTAFEGADKTATLSEGVVTETTGFNGSSVLIEDLIGSLVVDQWGQNLNGIFFIKVK